MSESEHVERKELLLNRLSRIGFTVNDPASETLHGDASDCSDSIEPARRSELPFAALSIVPSSSGGDITGSALYVFDSVARSETILSPAFDRFSFDPKGVDPVERKWLNKNGV